MTTSEKATAAIKKFEQLRLKAYADTGGVWTIGWGHTAGVKRGMQITQRQAESLLRGDLLKCEKYVDSLHLKLKQGQYDALVDFCFNLGAGRLASSTLLKKIQAHAPDTEIAAQFRRWVYGKDKTGKAIKLGGLVTRREWEVDMWMTV